jgi:hypothetical protein
VPIARFKADGTTEVIAAISPEASAAIPPPPERSKLMRLLLTPGTAATAVIDGFNRQRVSGA